MKTSCISRPPYFYYIVIILYSFIYNIQYFLLFIPGEYADPWLPAPKSLHYLYFCPTFLIHNIFCIFIELNTSPFHRSAPKSLYTRRCGRTWSRPNRPSSPRPRRTGWLGFGSQRGSSPSCWSPRWTSTSSSASPATPWRSEATWTPRAMAWPRPKGLH